MKEKASFYTAIDLPPRRFAPSGSRMTPVFGLVENKERGITEVAQIGEHDLYKEVQECRASCDLKELIRRYEAGDDRAFDVKPGFFADVSDLSGYTLGEVNNLMTRLRDHFNSAPARVRASFDNNFDVYVSRLGFAPVPQQDPAPSSAPEPHKEDK